VTKPRHDRQEFAVRIRGLSLTGSTRLEALLARDIMFNVLRGPFQRVFMPRVSKLSQLQVPVIRSTAMRLMPIFSKPPARPLVTDTAGDTIFALSSPPGRAAVAVVRISGPAARSSLALLCDRANSIAARQATLRTLRHPETKEVLDSGLVLMFDGPHSFTGEDVCELHLHGSRATVKAVLSCLHGIPTLRPAAPGEFTRRAFSAGKLDLTAVEGLSDLLNADTDAQRRQALSHLSGGPARLFTLWRAELTRALAHVEAHCDFADEDDADDKALNAAKKMVLHTVAELRQHLDVARSSRCTELRDGFAVALMGAPNAGKSSLLNVLAGRDVAIVSEIPGTTRDVLEVRLDLGGLPVVLADTAGLRDTPADTIEAQGIARARAAAQRAAVRLCVVDATERAWPPPPTVLAELVGCVRSAQAAADPTVLLVVNKLDAVADTQALRQRMSSIPAICALLAADESNGFAAPWQTAADLQRASTCDASRRVHFTSCLGAADSRSDASCGIDGLLASLKHVLQPQSHESAVFVRSRHLHHATACLSHLEAFLAKPPSQLDLAGEDLRCAVREVGALTGRVHLEEVLDVLFASLCIGK